MTEVEPPDPPLPRERPWRKIFLVSFLGGLVLFLCATIITVEDLLEQKRASLKQKGPTSPPKDGRRKDDTSKVKPEKFESYHVHSNRESTSNIAEAYWHEALSYMDWEDAVISIDPSDSQYVGTASKYDAANAVFALRKAAQHGHATAQFYLANALSTGFHLFSGGKDALITLQENSDTSTPQQQQALLLYHSAAINGNVEAALTLANRMSMDPKDACEDILPYYSTASHAILDKISHESAARITPANDRHELHLVHMHGSTPSRLEIDNRPSESPHALQFYAVKAATGAPGEAARAAFTLAMYYESGMRGSEQNATLALKYFEQAGDASHWEAAGHAGLFYLWGVATKPNFHRALELFHIGTPNGLKGCQQRINRKRKTNNNELSLCDKFCLTGMGLLHLWGISNILSQDYEMAVSYLQLAKEHGDADASYYLAMMKLGWHTHYRPVDDLEDQGQSPAVDFMLQDSTAHPSVQDYQDVLTELATAAGRGHLLARHRLGLLHEEGVQIGKHNVIKKDCKRATQQYRSFLHKANPYHAARMRRAYEMYTAGDTGGALRNYLIAAEAGSDIALLNSAFIMEKGECLLLSPDECIIASLRLYKIAATKGHSEASLRVGDHLYYKHRCAPLGWFRSFVYPEEVIANFVPAISKLLQGLLASDSSKSTSLADQQDVSQCVVEGTCPSPEMKMLADLETAAHFYQMAANRNSPRGHFNLGFLYEWGLGLKQDFPLAKRHYDLAMSNGKEEAEVPAYVALLALRAHEALVKRWRQWHLWIDDAGDTETRTSSKLNSQRKEIGSGEEL